jgi:hypothetical protein
MLQTKVYLLFDQPLARQSKERRAHLPRTVGQE